MIIDEEIPLDFMGVVYTMTTLSIMKKSFLVPKNKQGFIPFHKKHNVNPDNLWTSSEDFSI